MFVHFNGAVILSTSGKNVRDAMLMLDHERLHSLNRPQILVLLSRIYINQAVSDETMFSGEQRSKA